MRNRWRCSCVLLIASLALAPVASAEEEDQAPSSDFVRTGFYLGPGIAVGFPQGWNDDFDNDLNEHASNLANKTAEDNLGATPRSLSLVVEGADLEDVLVGMSGVIGYRAGERVAFEVEGEWLVDSNETDLDVTGSTGSHSAEVGEIWTITANVKAYPPFTGRFQPFGKVGLGLQHSRLEVDLVTAGLTTTNEPGTIEVPADFVSRSIDVRLDGAVRIGGGIDIYATSNIVAELNADYVLPFSKVGRMTTDFMSLQCRLVYRF